MAAILLVVTGLGPDVIDVPAARDTMRAVFKDPEDIEYSIRYEDPGYELILPSGVELTAKQRSFLQNWTYANNNKESYGLSDLMRELRGAGAATPAKQMNIVVTLKGERHQKINVDAIYPVEVHRTAPYNGTWINIPPQDGGSTFQMMFDFDEHTPRARTTVGGDDGIPPKPGQPYFRKNTLTVKDGIEDTLNISTIGTRHAVTFKIRIDYRIGGKPRHMVIADHDRPFVITPINCIDRIPVDKNGKPVVGHASYDHIWSLGGGDIASVKNPRRWSTEYYC
ncbi:hypothetical protein DKM19_21410 [Streptosporangium sp. 'caverna']|nr:hypothetical protein DKM19_21410 [Streptosporangium sp. 'caverna']